MTRAQRLFDTVTRHQFYIEGLKAYQRGLLNMELLAAERDIREAVLALTVTDMAELTKKQIEGLIIHVNAILKKHHSRYFDQLIAWLKSYLDIENPTYSEAIQDDDNGVVPILAGPVDTDSITSRTFREPLPANGTSATATMASLVVTGQDQLRSLIKRAAVNHDSPTAVARSIVGNPSIDYRDGLINKLVNSSNAASSTIIQFASALMSDGVHGRFTERYMWSSVIDSKTTEICLHRDGHIYVRGRGPLPPAHFNCRSHTVPIIMRDRSPVRPPDLVSWLRDQPDEFLADILPTRLATALRGNKKLSDEDIRRLSKVKPLTLEKYATKVNLMKTGTKG